MSGTPCICYKFLNTLNKSLNSVESSKLRVSIYKINILKFYDFNDCFKVLLSL